MGRDCWVEGEPPSPTVAYPGREAGGKRGGDGSCWASWGVLDAHLVGMKTKGSESDRHEYSRPWVDGREPEDGLRSQA